MSLILVVEDSPTQAEKLRLVLEGAGFAVRVAPDARRGLALFDASDFDLVLSDVIMPGLDGYELCRRLKRHPERGHVPVVLLTQLKSPQDILRGLECGADSYVPKPYEPEALLDRVRHALQNGPQRAGIPNRHIECSFLGKRFTVPSAPGQILELLIATCEEVVRGNRELAASRAELAAARDELSRQNSRLEEQNSRLAESEARYRALFESASDAILVADEEARYLEVNAKAECLTGYRRDELLRMRVMDLIPPTMPERGWEMYQALRARGRMEGEYVLLRKDGTRVEVEFAASRVGRGRYQSILRDVTQRKQAEQALRRDHQELDGQVRERTAELARANVQLRQEVQDRIRAERRLSIQNATTAVLAQAHDLEMAAPEVLRLVCEGLGWSFGALWTRDEQAGVLRCARSWCQAPPAVLAEFEEITRRLSPTPGVSLPGRVWAADQPVWLPDVLDDDNFPRKPEAARAGLHAALAFPVPGSGGLLGVLEFFSTHIEEPDRELLATLAAVGRQIGQFIERRRAEKDLEQERQFLRAVLESVGDGIVTCDAHGTLTLFNRAARELHGLGAEPRPPGEWAARYALYAEDGRTPLETAQIPLFRALGGKQVRDARIVIAPADSPARLVVCSGRQLLGPRGEALGAVACMTDVTELARSAEALRQAERKYRDIFESALDGIFQTTAEGRYLSANPALARMYGYDSPQELIAAVSDIARQIYVEPGRRAEFVRLMEADGRVTGFVSQVTRKDGMVIWISENSRAVRDAQGRLLYYEGFLRDVTERRNLEEQLLQAQKMEAVGQLAGGVAHDFNNLLTVINGYTEVALINLPERNAVRRMLEEVHQAGERAAALTGQLLAFSRKQVVQAQVLDLNGIVAETEKMLRRLIGEDVALATALDRALGRVQADPGQVQQVLINLAVNARDAMPQGGKLTIETRNVELDNAYARGHLEVRPGPYVLLAVSDTGTGMTEEVRRQLFLPFFTTKGPGKGTGLGLAVVHGVVKQAGGAVSVYSEPGRGTTFKIYLPRAEAAEEAPRTAPPATPVPRGEETVLLVEDEGAVRELARDILRLQGYTVLAAEDAAAALRLAATHAGTIHLLLTDIVMPGMGGRALAERLTGLRPGLRLLFISGYTDDAVVRHGVLSHEVAFLQKPFRPEDLARKVRAVLDAAAGPAVSLPVP